MAFFHRSLVVHDLAAVYDELANACVASVVREKRKTSIADRLRNVVRLGAEFAGTGDGIAEGYDEPVHLVARVCDRGKSFNTRAVEHYN
jgi:hypothetical protein